MHKIGKSTEIDVIKRNQTDGVELKNSLIEFNCSLQRYNNKFEQAKERISQLENRTIEIIESEEQKEKRLKKSKQSLRDF